jgi:hypothetical protein
VGNLECGPIRRSAFRLKAPAADGGRYITPVTRCDSCSHLGPFQAHTMPSEEPCGKVKFVRNQVLTFSRAMLISMSSLEATLQDREAEQTLFDN